MKTKLISYWVTTIFTALELLAGGVTDLMHGRTALVAGEPVAEVLAHLGYPVYLLTILGVWKLLGAIVLLAPRFPRLKARTDCATDIAGHIVCRISRHHW